MVEVFDHLVILPVVLPLFAGIVLVLIDDRHHELKLTVNIAATVCLLAAAAALLGRAGDGPEIGVYRLGDWPPPFAIVLVADRLSALMVMLTAVLAVSSVLFSTVRWHRAGPHFHSLFQLLLMGLNGAFLTGDLFNLFVFFEVLLAASYGLALHGSGIARVKAGLHYIAFNLATSSAFLIGVSLIYGVAGTLNMADLAARIPLIPEQNRALLEAGAAILGVAFLVKAGMWPLSFWLPSTYAVASPPVAAMFAVMSKVGIYVVLRLSVLLFGEGAGASAHLADQWLIYGGIATIAFGTVGVLSSQQLARMTGFSVLVSSGTLLAMVGYENVGVSASALYYLVSSTLALSCLFLVVDLMERGRPAEADVLAVTLEAFGDDEEEERAEEVGVATPGSLALLSAAFGCCALLLAGIPPLSGFLAKFAMIGAVLNLEGLGTGTMVASHSWVIVGLLVVSGLAALIAMLRAGINTFWAGFEHTIPRVSGLEMTPILLLLGVCVALTVFAGPAMTYMSAAASDLHLGDYIGSVLGTTASTQ